MTSTVELDRKMARTNRRTVVLLVALFALTGWTLATVQIGQGEERAQLREQNRLLEDQNALLEDQNLDLAGLMKRQAEVDSDRAARIQGALGGVEGLLVDHFATHDENVALKLNELLARIAALLDRPVLTEPIQPAVAAPASSTAQPVPTTETDRSPGRTPPATTTPDQKSCAKRPDGPRC